MKRFNKEMRNSNSVFASKVLLNSVRKNTNAERRQSCATRRGGGKPPLPFFENQKSALIFGKKGPDCIHLWIKFFIRNAVLVVSRWKNSKLFPCGALFSCVFEEMFIEVP